MKKLILSLAIVLGTISVQAAVPFDQHDNVTVGNNTR